MGRAPFARSIAAGRGDLAVLGAALDRLPPSPDTALLLSAQEAKAQLRGIVEGFCFRRLRNQDGKGAPRRLLIKSPPGLVDETGYPPGRPLPPAANRARAAARSLPEPQKPRKVSNRGMSIVAPSETLFDC
jgi:hypothetical protein